MSLQAGQRVCFTLRGALVFGRVVRVRASTVELTYQSGPLTQSKTVKLTDICA